jgi:uncharacterized protein YgiM (DUF1202 family)
MYDYGNSGNIWGIVIGIIIGAIIIFLICRELICWYYKINRLVALMEVQNKLLVKLLAKMTNKKFDYVVNDNTDLRTSPITDDSSSLIITLKKGMFLTFLEKDESNYWIKVQTENDEIGWCLSGNTREI